jgi:hypothetical protein
VALLEYLARTVPDNVMLQWHNQVGVALGASGVDGIVTVLMQAREAGRESDSNMSVPLNAKPEEPPTRSR